MSLSELKTKYRKLSSLEKARNGWEDEYEVSSKQVCFLNQKESLEYIEPLFFRQENRLAQNHPGVFLSLGLMAHNR